MSDTMPAPMPTEPLRRRILRALLYGKADRATKARGRIGLERCVATLLLL